jgi:hypothetical protein
MNFKSRVQKKGSRYYASLEKEEKRIHGTFAVGYKEKVLANIPVEVRTKKEETTPDKKSNTKKSSKNNDIKSISIKNSHELNKSPLLKSGNRSNSDLYKEFLYIRIPGFRFIKVHINGIPEECLLPAFRLQFTHFKTFTRLYNF